MENPPEATPTRAERLKSTVSKYRYAVASVCLVGLCVVIALCVVLLRPGTTELPRRGYVPFYDATGEVFNEFADGDYLKDVEHVPISVSMNPGTDPCDDFYDYACGRWLPQTDAQNDTKAVSKGVYISQKSSVDDSFGYLQKQINDRVKKMFLSSSTSNANPKMVNGAIDFYKYCIDCYDKDKDFSSTLKQLLKEFGGWPILDGKAWSGEKYSREESIALILRILGLQTFVGVDVTVDSVDTNKNILLIRPPKVPSFSLSDVLYGDLLHSTVKSMNSSQSEEDIAKDIADIAALEEKVRRIVKNPKQETRRITIFQLQNEIPKIDWLRLIEELTKEAITDTKYTKGDVEVQVKDLESLQHFFQSLDEDEFSPRSVANFFGYYVVANTYMFYPKVIKQYAKYNDFNLDIVLSIFKESCYMKITENFQPALDYLFTQHVKNDRDSGTVIDYSKKALRAMVKASKWLDEVTRRQIIKKIDSMSEVVGYTHLFSSKANFDDVYGDFPDINENVAESYIYAKRYLTNLELKDLNKKNSLKQWKFPLSFTYLGSYYEWNRNAIVFALAMQNPPYYYHGGPEYLNFGAAGTIISHEINHGFDDKGRMRNQKGNKEQVWTDAAVDNYNNRLECFDAQLKEFNRKIGEVEGTARENMADSNGLRQSYLAYDLWRKEHGPEKSYTSGELSYSPDQMFFLSYASMWCSSYSKSSHRPHSFRVNSAVSNSEDFTKAFNCSVGSPMNPKDKCTLW